MAVQPKDRRLELRGSATLNGIDFVKVVSPTRLQVFFFNKNAVAITKASISGGESVIGIRVMTDVTKPAAFSVGDVLILTLDTDRTGDFSEYTLSLEGDFKKLDRHTASVAFSFKSECDTDLDCASACAGCPPADGGLPPIDYLARDYMSFRRALSDFSALRYPDWKERSEADSGVMFLESLCALADNLAYTQDRVAWEGKLETATQALSIRRLARLVDYEPRPATIASVLLQFEVSAAGTIPAGTIVNAASPEGDIIPFETGEGLADKASATVSPLWNRRDNAGKPRINPYWWDDTERCLPAGSTEMWVTGKGFAFTQGMRLLIDTANAAGDPATRQIVTLAQDGEETQDPLFGNIDVTRIAWNASDALAKSIDLRHTVLAGNIVSATQGRRYAEAFAIDKAPAAMPYLPLALARTGPSPVADIGFRFRDGDDMPGNSCGGASAPAALPRYLYSLANAPLAYLAGSDGASPMPEITVEQVSPTPPPAWTFLRDLLSATPLQEAYTIDPARYAVVGRRPSDGLAFYDYDGDNGATVRFGDGTFGETPQPETVFQARYRTGAGKAGNVAPDTIIHVAPENAPVLLSLITAVTNPLAATGGTDAETAESVRQMAPFAFRAKQFRAVLPGDYEDAAETLPLVERAGTSFRWTGSWLSVFTAADPRDGFSLPDEQRTDLVSLLNRYRMAGYESYIRPPQYASLDITITLCALPNAFQGDVHEAVVQALSLKTFFHPDNFTFGTPLERSRLEAAVQSQPGVAGITSIQYRRRGYQATPIEMPAFIPIGREEVLRVDNDPSLPEFGSITVIVNGGK